MSYRGTTGSRTLARGPAPSISTTNLPSFACTSHRLGTDPQTLTLPGSPQATNHLVHPLAHHLRQSTASRRDLTPKPITWASRSLGPLTRASYLRLSLTRAPKAIFERSNHPAQGSSLQNLGSKALQNSGKRAPGTSLQGNKSQVPLRCPSKSICLGTQCLRRPPRIVCPGTSPQGNEHRVTSIKQGVLPTSPLQISDSPSAPSHLPHSLHHFSESLHLPTQSCLKLLHHVRQHAANQGHYRQEQLG